MNIKQLLCFHKYPKIVYSTDCVNTVVCEKCGKHKEIIKHDFKLRVSQCTMLSTITGIPIDYITNGYKCKKCNIVKWE